MIIVFRCQNGVVAYVIRRNDISSAMATCLNDKTTMTLSRAFDASWIAAFTTMGQHAVALHGNILETIYLPPVVL